MGAWVGWGGPVLFNLAADAHVDYHSQAPCPRTQLPSYGSSYGVQDLSMFGGAVAPAGWRGRWSVEAAERTAPRRSKTAECRRASVTLATAQVAGVERPGAAGTERAQPTGFPPVKRTHGNAGGNLADSHLAPDGIFHRGKAARSCSSESRPPSCILCPRDRGGVFAYKSANKLLQTKLRRGTPIHIRAAAEPFGRVEDTSPSSHPRPLDTLIRLSSNTNSPCQGDSHDLSHREA
ncbi:hypothetical protein GN956_G25213 [Arapaima gigas]